MGRWVSRWFGGGVPRRELQGREGLQLGGDVRGAELVHEQGEHERRHGRPGVWILTRTRDWLLRSWGKTVRMIRLSVCLSGWLAVPGRERGAQRVGEHHGGDAVRVVGRGREGDGEVARGHVEACLGQLVARLGEELLRPAQHAEAEDEAPRVLLPLHAVQHAPQKVRAHVQKRLRGARRLPRLPWPVGGGAHELEQDLEDALPHALRHGGDVHVFEERPRQRGRLLRVVGVVVKGE